MPRMGKTEEDWKGFKLGFLKTVQPNSFSKLIPAATLSRVSDFVIYMQFLCLL